MPDVVNGPDEELIEGEAREVELVPDLSEQEPPAPPQPTVHILVERRDDGGAAVDVVATGDVRVTEVESLLKLAVKHWETKAGL